MRPQVFLGVVKSARRRGTFVCPDCIFGKTAGKLDGTAGDFILREDKHMLNRLLWCTVRGEGVDRETRVSSKKVIAICEKGRSFTRNPVQSATSGGTRRFGAGGVERLGRGNAARSVFRCRSSEDLGIAMLG